MSGWKLVAYEHEPSRNHISEDDLLAGYAGLRGTTQPARTAPRDALIEADLTARITGAPVPEELLLRGRRCPCGNHAERVEAIA